MLQQITFVLQVLTIVVLLITLTFQGVILRNLRAGKRLKEKQQARLADLIDPHEIDPDTCVHGLYKEQRKKDGSVVCANCGRQVGTWR